MSKAKPVNLTPKPTVSAVQQIYGQIGIQSPQIEQDWNELEAIFQESAHAIVTTAESIDAALRTPGIIENMPNIAETQLAVQGFKKDLEVFTEKLLGIHNRHQDKQGAIATQDDLALSIDIGEDYAEFALQFQAVTMPTVLTIMEHIGTAVGNSQAAANVASEQKDTEQ